MLNNNTVIIYKIVVMLMCLSLFSCEKRSLEERYQITLRESKNVNFDIIESVAYKDSKNDFIEVINGVTPVSIKDSHILYNANINCSDGQCEFNVSALSDKNDITTVQIHQSGHIMYDSQVSDRIKSINQENQTQFIYWFYYQCPFKYNGTLKKGEAVVVIIDRDGNSSSIPLRLYENDKEVGVLNIE